MQYELYEYANGEVTLSFKFAVKESMKEDKKKFLELLKKAAEDLEKTI